MHHLLADARSGSCRRASRPCPAWRGSPCTGWSCATGRTCTAGTPAYTAGSRGRPSSAKSLRDPRRPRSRRPRGRRSPETDPPGSAPERVNSSVWQTPLALISTSTSPALGPARSSVTTSSGLPAAYAIAALVFMPVPVCSSAWASREVYPAGGPFHKRLARMRRVGGDNVSRKAQAPGRGAQTWRTRYSGRIIRGEIPCHKVYEDEQGLRVPGHQPLEPRDTLWSYRRRRPRRWTQLSDESAAALGRVLPQAVPRGDRGNRRHAVQRPREQRQPARTRRSPHVHFHIIPKPNAREGLGIGWPQKSLDPKVGTALAAAIRDALT